MKFILIMLGTTSLVLGVIGAFLPVLPTTPFILLAAFCFIRSSQRMYDWVMKSRFVGKHVINVLEGKGIPLSVKIVSVAISVSMIGWVGIFRTESTLVRTLLAAILLVQIYFMFKIKTLKVEEHSKKSVSLNPET